MLSTAYRKKLEEIANRIVNQEEVALDEMVWAQKLAAHNQSAAKILRQSRRKSQNPEMKEGDLDDFLNQMDLGDPDSSNHKTKFDGPDDIANWFHNPNPDRRRD